MRGYLARIFIIAAAGLLPACTVKHDQSVEQKISAESEQDKRWKDLEHKFETLHATASASYKLYGELADRLGHMEPGLHEPEDAPVITRKEFLDKVRGLNTEADIMLLSLADLYERDKHLLSDKHIAGLKACVELSDRCRHEPIDVAAVFSKIDSKEENEVLLRYIDLIEKQFSFRRAVEFRNYEAARVSLEEYGQALSEFDRAHGAFRVIAEPAVKDVAWQFGYVRQKEIFMHLHLEYCGNAIARYNGRTGVFSDLPVPAVR